MMDMLDFFAGEYNDIEWNEYANCFNELNIHVTGIPQDIVNAIYTILGRDAGYKWLHAPLQKFNNRNAVDLLKTEKGEKALKAFIMRFPN
ncbi:MAG: DUF2384 domain-containing protein [Lachnospiraceae bacterium]|nr:DUF2384 domain-containing protein [Lachnospiraceae bacterium]